MIVKNEMLSKQRNKVVKDTNTEFNFDDLPKSMGDYIKTCYAEMGLNKDMMLTATLCSISGMIGKRCAVISPNGYKVMPSLYALNVAPSGSNKSSSIDYALKKLEDINSDRVNSYANRYNNYLDKLQEYKDSKKNQKLNSVPPKKPLANYYLMGNYTWQALVSSLNFKNRHGVIIRNDEIEPLLDRITNGSNSDEKSLLLSASTNGSFSKETKGEEVPENIENLCLSIIGSIQNEVAEKYFARADRSGMLARFQLFAYSNNDEFVPMKIGNKNCANTIDNHIHHEKIYDLTKIPDRYTAGLGGLDDHSSKIFTFSDDANSIIANDFYNNYIKSEIKKCDKLILEEYIRKMIYTVQSISLSLHIYENGHNNTVIDSDIANTSVKLCKYFYSMFKRFMSTSKTNVDIPFEVKEISKYTKYKSFLCKDGFFTVAVYHNRRTKIKGATQIDNKQQSQEILDLLVDSNILDMIIKKGKPVYKMVNGDC